MNFQLVKSRSEIMKLIFKNSDIMLLDEPTAVLTPKKPPNLRIHWTTFSEDEKTIVLITHKLKEIKEFGKIFVMKNGKMVRSLDEKCWW